MAEGSYLQPGEFPGQHFQINTEGQKTENVDAEEKQLGVRLLESLQSRPGGDSLVTRLLESPELWDTLIESNSAEIKLAAPLAERKHVGWERVLPLLLVPVDQFVQSYCPYDTEKCAVLIDTLRKQEILFVGDIVTRTLQDLKTVISQHRANTLGYALGEFFTSQLQGLKRPERLYGKRKDPLSWGRMSTFPYWQFTDGESKEYVARRNELVRPQ